MTFDRRLPPLNALRAFEAAGRHLSFKDAAEELNVTPAAVSQQVKRLEEFLARSQPAGLVGGGLDGQRSPLLLDVDRHPAPTLAGVGLQALSQRGSMRCDGFGGGDGD